MASKYLWSWYPLTYDVGALLGRGSLVVTQRLASTVIMPVHLKKLCIAAEVFGSQASFHARRLSYSM